MEFRILTEDVCKGKSGTKSMAHFVLSSELTVEESLELIQQLIENLKCKECKGSGKKLTALDDINRGVHNVM